MGIPTYIIGVGGLGRGVAETVKVIERRDLNWSLKGFIDEHIEQHGNLVNGLEVLGDLSLLLELKQVSNVIIAIANPSIKKRIHENLIKNPLILFPNVIHPSTKLNPTINLGIGNIISENVSFSSNVKVGSFCLVHFNSSVGHDVEVEDYVTVYPGVNLSGHSKISLESQVGTNASILPQLTVGKGAYIGANSMVNKDVPSNSTVVGVPAKKLNEKGGLKKL